tara:strand:- start:276 stop:1109 length:834 start_codon:yes stop_codon:yes gene_type:complete
MPIRDNPDLLNYTLNNFKDSGLTKLTNIIVVDDRSTALLEEICTSFKVNYLRIDNKKGFNFSMLNNIPSYLVKKLGGKIVLFWNSDLWIDKIEYLKELLSKHNENNSTISGSKLLYPHKSLNDSDSTNIKVHFPHMSEGKYKGKVQFAGARFVRSPTGTFVPVHFKRFAEREDSRVNQDYATEFVTGALQVINLDWFLKIGGFNPSLSKVFQDVDLCLRALEDKKNVYYFGKNMHFYHDESFNHFSNKDEKKMDKQFESDDTLFNKIWAQKIVNLIF